MKPVLRNGAIENGTHHRCRQTQCGFFINGGCKECDDCKAAPYEIRKSCSRCNACETVPDSLRWGEKKLLNIKQTVPQLEVRN